MNSAKWQYDRLRAAEFKENIDDLLQGRSYANTRGQVLVMHATANGAITMKRFATPTTELEAAGINHNIATYAGAPHGFTVFGSPRYREQADRRSWKLSGEFLHEVNRCGGLTRFLHRPLQAPVV